MTDSRFFFEGARTRQRRIEVAANDVMSALDEWLRVLPARYVGKPLTQDDVSLIADATNHLRAALHDRRRING